MARRRIDWPAVAQRFAERLPLERAHPRVRAWLAGQERSRARWAVACSGGADSLALLLWVWAHWPARRSRLVVLHFNHRLRGRAATADARFCVKVAAALGLEIRAEEWAEAPKQASEAQARRARQAFFTEQTRALRARALWLGHQQDDVAETLLMRLARGSATGGLAAPRPVQVRPDGVTALRPFLSVPKSELVSLLAGAGAVWREDDSNATDQYFRNRLRRNVLPAWQRAAGRDAFAGAALSRDRLEEDDEALEQWLVELRPFDESGALVLATLAGKPRALWRRALHQWLLRNPHGSDLSRHGFEELLSKTLAGAATRFSLGSRGFACIRSGRLVFE